MKGILSKHDSEKKAKRNRMILGLILVFIMFFSIAEYSFLSNQNQANNAQNQTNAVNYNGFQFSEQNSYWILNKDGNDFIFSYNPNEIPRITSIVNPLENYNGKTLYLISNNSIVESDNLSTESQARKLKTASRT